MHAEMFIHATIAEIENLQWQYWASDQDLGIKSTEMKFSFQNQVDCQAGFQHNKEFALVFWCTTVTIKHSKRKEKETSTATQKWKELHSV